MKLRLDGAMTDARKPGAPVKTEEDQVGTGDPLPRDPEALERQRVLGTRLGELWEVDEAIPDEFQDLLDKLDEQSEQS